MTALVTGATGFVGSAVARRLLAAGETVRVLARPGGDRRNLEGLAVEIAEGDLTDPASLDPAVAGCDVVFHVAADYRLWTRDPASMHRTNVDGSVAVVRAATKAGAARIVYTSSIATLGLMPDGTPADERTPVRFEDMIGPYKQTKFLAEQAVRGLIRDEGAPVVIVHPSAPVGPRDIKPTPTGRLIADAAAGRMPAYVDTGLNVVHVDDVAEGHVLAWRKGEIGEGYVLGGENLTLAEIFAHIAALVGRKPPRIRLPHGAIMPVAWAVERWARLFGGEPFVTMDGVRLARKMMFFSSAKAERALGYRARPVDDAFADAIAWFRANGYLG